MLKAPHPYVRFPDLFFFLSWKIHHHKSSHSATILPVNVGKLRHGGVRTLPRIQHPSVVSHCYFYFSCWKGCLVWAVCPCCHLPLTPAPGEGGTPVPPASPCTPRPCSQSPWVLPCLSQRNQAAPAVSWSQIPTHWRPGVCSQICHWIFADLEGNHLFPRDFPINLTECLENPQGKALFKYKA